MSKVRILLFAATGALVVLSGLYAVLAVTVTESAFEDPALEAAVREELNARGGHIPRGDLERLTELDASELGIESLEGIDSAPNLTNLNLRGNRIDDLRPLAGLERLQSLNLRDNNIQDLNDVHVSALSELPELVELSLRHNRGPSHPETPDDHRRISDISALADLTGLEVLDLRDNHIENVSALSRLEALRELDLRNNRLTEDAVSPLSALVRLEHLNLRNNDLRDISALSANTSLRYLNIHSNENIETVVPLSSLSGLETLIARRVPIGTDAGVLRELTSLTRLNVRETGIEDLTFLADLMELGALQDRPQQGVFAEVDILENPVEDSGSGSGYRVLEPWWDNIAVRSPQVLP